MSSNYPGSLDNFSTSHADNVNEAIHASTVNDLADAVNKIESTLGANPSYTLSGVLSRGADAGAVAITNLADPTNAQDAATKNYVDSHTGSSSGTVMPTTAITATTNPTTHAATTAERFLPCDATSGRIEVTLPAPSGNTGYTVTIRKTDSSSHNVFVKPNATELLDGQNFVDSGTGETLLAKLSIRYDSITLVSDGTNWQRVDAGEGVTGIYYVDGNNGNDLWPGLSPKYAKKTIQAAVSLVSAGTVYVAPGTYTETVDISGKSGLRIIGNQEGFSDSSGVLAVNWHAPTSTTSCLVGNSATDQVEVSYINFFGGSGLSSTYTGVVVDCSNFGLGCRFHDIAVMGIAVDFTGSKKVIGPGVYGGTGIKIDNMEQMEFRNVNVANCHVGILVDGTVTESKLTLRNISLDDCFISFQEVSGGVAGANLYEQWKSQNCFGLTFAIAILNSDTTNPADGDTITIRDQTYRFKSTMALANDVQIGATYDATLLSLSKAVNQTGVVGTDYFTGTVAPTAMQAGKFALPENGGGMAFTKDSIDTTNHQMAFQLTDVVGPSGNGLTASTTSTHLSFGQKTGAVGFERAAWGHEFYYTNTCVELDFMENISYSAGNCALIACSNSNWIHCVGAPQTTVSVTGSYNWFKNFGCQKTFTIQSGAIGNVVDNPLGSNSGAPGSNFTDKGTNTRWLNVRSVSNGRTDVSASLNARSGYGFPSPSVTGRYYASPQGSPLTTFTPTVGRLYFFPILIPEWSLQFGDVSINVTAGAASSKAYLGLYAPGAGGLPQTWDGNNFLNEAIATTGTGTASFGTFAQNRSGLMWLALGFTGGTPTVTGVASGTPASPLVGSATLSDMTGGGGQAYYIDSVLSATFPYFSTITPANLLVASGAPAIFYKYV